MSYKLNSFSILGRMSYQVHLLFYPAALLTYIMAIKPYMKARSEKAVQDEWDALPKAKVLDPDLFNPFSPIPYHNSKEVKYSIDHIRMFNYVNKNHLSVKDYPWKSYHNSYDHNNTNAYLYNWTSTHEPIDV